MMIGTDDPEKAREAEEALRLFAQYRETGSIEIRNELVLRYMNTVNYIAMSTRNMYSKYCDPEDIVNEAVIALMSAVDSYDPDKNTKFETYASLKIRGAVIDYIRRQDIIPRSVRRFAKEYDSAYAKLYSELDREPTNEELAAELDVPPEKLDSMITRSAAAQTFSFEEMVFEGGYDVSDPSGSDNGWQPEQGLLGGEMFSQLTQAIDSLGERERLVISLYYYEKLKYSEIAEVVGVSESRVCQIHSAAVKKMKKFFEEYIDE